MDAYTHGHTNLSMFCSSVLLITDEPCHPLPGTTTPLLSFFLGCHTRKEDTNVKSLRTSASLRPRVATCNPKGRHPYPLGCDVVRSSTRQRVLDVCCA